MVGAHIRDLHLQRLIDGGDGLRQLQDGVQQRAHAVFDLWIEPGLAPDGRGVDDVEICLLVRCAELAKQVKRLVHYHIRIGLRLVDFVQDHEHLLSHRNGLLEDEARLRLGALGSIDNQQDAIHHIQHALHLATKVRVSWRVHDVDLDILPRNCRVLCQDCDAALALLVVAVHEPIVLSNCRRHGLGVLQQSVH